MDFCWVVGQWACSVIGGALVVRLAPTECLCEFEDKADKEVLKLLSRQLDRCGPANLTTPSDHIPPPALQSLEVVFIFALGVTFGLLIATYLHGRVHPIPTPPAGPALAVTDSDSSHWYSKGKVGKKGRYLTQGEVHQTS